MRKHHIILIFFLLSMILISGCHETNFFNIESTMSPPELSEDDIAVKALVMQTSGSDVIWKYPKRGEYKSSITFCSLDNVYTQALVTYQESGENNKSHFMILDKSSGEWNILNNFVQNSSGVDKVIITDLNGDGVNEIVIGWNGVDGNSNHVSLYTYNNNTSKEFSVCEKYTDFSAYDFDIDNSAELLIVYHDSDQKKASFELAKIVNDNINKTPLTLIKSDVEKLESLCVGIIDDRRHGAFMDFRQVDNSVITEILYWDSNIKKLIVYNNVNNLEEFTLKNNYIMCSDINNDGKIELPIVSEEDLYIDEDASRRIVNIIKWSNFNISSGKFNCVQKCVYGKDYDYRFVLPDEWDFNVVASYEDNNDILFLGKKIKYGSEDRIEDILSIRKVNENSWKDHQNKGNFVVLGRKKGVLYISEIYENSSGIYISKDKLIKNFKFAGN